MENSCLNINDDSRRTVGTQTSFLNSEKQDCVTNGLEKVIVKQETNSFQNSNDEVQEKYKTEARAMGVIKSVLDSVEELRQQVENFSGSSIDDKDYKYLDEMMIRDLVTLDDLHSEGNIMIQQERRRAVQYIQKLMNVLDAKLRENREAVQRILQNLIPPSSPSPSSRSNNQDLVGKRICSVVTV
ncbi:hypothetical protein RN001_014229 [Aquatica leii]|uniref:BAG domain-containing protein n=1 Tax=Aquatica leii TaxID=1421715 RepID=A0AAN7P1A9_9COLE|nr:hypothetical protein RN001_014229 [Aquatica leii]